MFTYIQTISGWIQWQQLPALGKRPRTLWGLVRKWLSLSSHTCINIYKFKISVFHACIWLCRTKTNKSFQISWCVNHSYNLTKRKNKFMFKSWKWKEPKNLLSHFINEKIKIEILITVIPKLILQLSTLALNPASPDTQ